MLPNAVLAGAPKSGTSSLFRWLADHPEVCGSSVKETRFLLDPDDCLFQKNSNVHEHGLSGYERYSTAAMRPGEGRPRGDTGLPLPADGARRALDSRYATGASFHLPPALRASVFAVPLPPGPLLPIHPRLDFRRFIELVREEDPRIPTQGHANFALAFGRYSDYLPAWLERFPLERFHFFLFEDLRHDPRSFVKAVAVRLGLEPSFYDDYAPPTENRSSPSEARGCTARGGGQAATSPAAHASA